MSHQQPIQSEQSKLPELTEDLARLAARLESTVVEIREPLAESLTKLVAPGSAAFPADLLATCAQAVARVNCEGGAIAVPTHDQHAIVFSGLCGDTYRVKIAARLPMPTRTARLLMQSAC